MRVVYVIYWKSGATHKNLFHANTTVTFLCVVMCVGVDIIHFEAFSMGWQQFHTCSIFDLLVTACTNKMLLISSCETPDNFD